MLNVFITVDTEIWCDGWEDLDRKFPKYFKSYVYGPTPDGDFALPGTLSILEEYNIPAVFFVEPLFSEKFGIEPLKEIVGLLQEKNQEIQLHMHPEWVDEVGDRLLPAITEKIPNMTYCTREQQSQLIRWAIQRMDDAGASHINAFRAGGFCANRATLHAVAENHLTFDSSYNLSGPMGVADIASGEWLHQPRYIDRVYEYPVSVIKDPIRGKYRNVQINALSLAELINCLETGFTERWDSLVVVTHNFELLSRDKTRVDKIVRKRFQRFCQYLDKNRDRFNVRGFRDLPPKDVQPQPPVMPGSLIPAGFRYAEQALRGLLYH